jgi:hypothetical protein
MVFVGLLPAKTLNGNRNLLSRYQVLVHQIQPALSSAVSVH